MKSKLFLNFLFVFGFYETGFSTFFEHNPNSQLITIIDSMEKRVDLAYDIVGRLAQMVYSDGKIVSYRYDANDNRIEMEDAQGITRFVYDDLDRLTSVSYPGLQPLIYRYNSSNQIIYIRYPSGEDIVYKYDSKERLIAVQTLDGITVFHYETTLNLPSKITLPNGVSTEYQYDHAKRVTEVIHRKAQGSTIKSYHYEYDQKGNCVLAKEESEHEHKTVKYTYDRLDRLINVIYSDGGFEKYLYDGFSNCTAKETDQGIEKYLYDDNNQLIQKGDTYFFYNFLGNLIKKEKKDAVTEYFYDGNNLLIEVKNAQHLVTFAYDGDGKRISKTVNGVTKRYINDAAFSISQVLLEIDQENRVQAQYLYADRRICCLTANRESLFYLYDHPAKNVAFVVDKAGHSQPYSYTPFGAVLDSPQKISNPFQYAGEQIDEETGLIYLRNRYYDPEIGRFITPDPYPGSLINPHTWNPYIYVLNNPINCVDPLGLNSFQAVVYPPGTKTDTGVSITGHVFGIHIRENGKQTPLGKYPTWKFFQREISREDKIYPGSVTYTWDNISPEVGKQIEKEFGQKGFYLLLKNNCTDAVVEVIQKYIEPDFGSKRPLGIHNPTSFMEALSEKKGDQCDYLDKLNREKNALWDNYESDPIAPSSKGIQHFLKHFLGAADRGGISLSKTADLMVNLTDIIGSIFDEKTGQLILIGKKNYHLPHLDPDDFAVAVRSVFGLGANPSQNPGISMDLYPRFSPEHIDVRYEGETKNTGFGYILFEADRLLKNLSLGKDNITGQKIKAHVKGYKSLPRRYDRDHFYPTSDSYSRLWFVPEEIRVINSSDSHTMQFEKVKMKTLSEVTYVGKSTFNHSIEDFARHITDYYSLYAEEFPVLQELERLGQITGVVKWIKENNIPFDLSFFKKYQPPFVSTPETTKLIVVPFGGFRHFIFGGVNYELGTHNYFQRTVNDLEPMKQMALHSRPSDTHFLWDFDDQDSSYVAVAQTIYRTPKTGNVKKTFFDMRFPVKGEYPLTLARTYNSFEDRTSGFGIGWDVAPAHLRFPEEKKAEKYFTILVKDEEGENIYLAKKFTAEGQILYESTKSSQILKTEPDGGFTLFKCHGAFFSFDTEGRLIRMTDQTGVYTNYFYDGAYLVQIQHQDGASIDLSYIDERIVTAKGPGNKTLHFTYNSEKQIESATDSLGPLATFFYDEEKRLIKICNPTGMTIFSAEYDIYARATALTDGPLSYRQEFDIGSGLFHLENNAHFASTQSIDPLYRISQIKDSLHRSMHISYEGSSFFPSTIEDPMGHQTRYTWDAKKHLRSIQRADGSTKEFWYDNKDRLTLSKNGKGIYTVTTYDDQDRVIMQATPCEVAFITEERANLDYRKGQITFYEYLGSSLKPSIVRTSSGKQNVFTYNQNDQLSRALFMDGTAINLEYDGRHRLYKIYENSTLFLEYTYNERDHVISIKTSSGVICYERDIQGNVTALIDANHNKTFFSYDGYNRLTQVIDPEGGVTQYTYDTLSRLEKMVFPGGIIKELSYDSLHRLSSELYSHKEN